MQIKNKAMLECIRVARDYKFAVIPVQARGKIPLTPNGVKNATSDTATVASYEQRYPNCNYGIATGKANGIVVIDEDEDGALQAFANGRTLPTTPTVRTAKGRHYYFRYDERCESLKNTTKPTGFDVRTNGGYVVGPGSVHSSGATYEWVMTPDECDFAPLPDWLFAELLKHSAPQSPAVCQPLRSGGSEGESERAVSYLEKTPPAISGQGGHNRTFATVCRLCELFPSLTDDEMLNALSDWNASCEPPWTDAELLHKIHGARERTPLPVSQAIDEDEADEWPTLSDDAYIGLAGEVVRRVEPHTEADPVAILVQLLSGFANLVGSGPHYWIGGNRHTGSLFVTLVGQSSKARKGTSLGIVKELLKPIDDAWKDRIMSGLSSGEGIIHALRDDDEQPSGAVIGPTIDRRLWVTESEFGGVLRMGKREGNILSNVIRQAWDGDRLQTLTKSDPLTATGAHVGIVGHITQDELSQTLSKTDARNGLANRFLWVCCRRSKLLPNGGDLPPLDDLRDRLREVTQLVKGIGRMDRSAEAQRVWSDAYEQLTADHCGVYDSVTSRAEAQALRLSIVYALLDGSPIIDARHVRAGLAVWDYCDRSAKLIFGSEEEDKLERTILDLLRTGPKTKTELRQAVSSPKRRTLNGTLSALVSQRRIREEQAGRTARYRLDSGRLDVPDANSESPQSPESSVQTVREPLRVQNAGRCPDVVAQSPQSPESSVQTVATAAELLDWKNANGAKVYRREDGLIWVTQEDRLPDRIRRAIEARQAMLAKFLPKSDQAERILTRAEYEDEMRLLQEEVCGPPKTS